MALQTEREKIAHLLRRFGLGASVAELEFYSNLGLKGAIDHLLNYSSIPDPFDVKPEVFGLKNKVLNPRGAQLYWYARLLATTRPLEEKLTLFWHNHFATSAQKVSSGEAMNVQIGTLRAHALGRFEDILNAVSKDPAMLYWLDNQENVKGKANENFAREVMELFTLGIGHYSEQDVQNAAKAFTGWSYGIERKGKIFPARNLPNKNVVFNFMKERHDNSVKNVLGNRGDFNGDDVLGILVGNLQTSRFVVHKMWEWFVYPHPEQALVDRLATDWRSHGLDVKRLVRTIMESSEFYSSKAERAVLKNPVDFVVPIARELGLGRGLKEKLNAVIPGDPKSLRGAVALPAFILGATKGQGMELLYPPDVSGWATGLSWISTATMVERIKFADKLFRGIQVDAKVGKNKGRNGAATYPAYALLAQNPTPSGMVATLLSTFDVGLPQAKVDKLVVVAQQASQGGLSAKNASYVANSVSRLLFACPEFQFS